MGALISSSPQPYLLLSVLWSIAIIECKVIYDLHLAFDFIIVLICISVMTHDVECLFTCLLVICTSLGNVYSNPFPINLFCELWNCKSSLCILGISSLSAI